MSATTPRYDITYPTGSDLVSQGPAQFKAMCESIDDALYLVDNRSLPNSIKPVIANTRDQLDGITGSPGQIAVVNDPTGGDGGYDDRAYYWNPVKNAWVELAELNELLAATFLNPNIIASSVFPDLAVTGYRHGTSCTINIDTNKPAAIPSTRNRIGTTTPSGRPYAQVRQFIAVQEGKWGWLIVEPDGNIYLEGQYGSLDVSLLHASITYTAGLTNQTPFN